MNHHLMLLGGYITYFIVLSLKATIKLTSEIFKAYSNHKTSVVAWGICSTPLYNCAGRGPPFPPHSAAEKYVNSSLFSHAVLKTKPTYYEGVGNRLFRTEIQIFPRILL